MDFSRFKDSKHPSANMRNEAVLSVIDHYGVEKYGKTHSIITSAVMKVFQLSELFLYRQYYHRDQARKALDNGDVETAITHLNMIGNSGHHMNNGDEVKC